MAEPGGLAAPRPASEAPASTSVLAVFAPIMLPVFLAVIDQTIVATALPAMARSLGEVERISWVVVAYLVANTIAAPVYGRLGDLFGRRLLMLTALAVFVAASLLCAVSTGIGTLTGARVLQGLGGGGLMTLSQALIGESVPPGRRGDFQGYLAAVIVCSSTFGPVAGGFLTQFFGWPSVFLINLPLGALAMLLVWRLPRTARRRGRVRFDALGLALLTGFITPLLLALERLQHFARSELPVVFALFALAGLCLAALAWQERRARAPLISPALLRNPAIWRADAMAGFSGASLVAMVTFLPIYLQVVGGAGPGETGFLMLPITAGVGIGSLLTGRLISRTGRTAIFPGIGLLVTAATLIAAALFAGHLGRAQLPWLLAVGAFCQGSAMPVAQITAQALAGPRMLGAAAGLVQLARSLGSALGVALVGGVLFATLAAADPRTAGLFAGMVEQGPAAMASLEPAQRAVVQAQIGGGFSAAFLTIACFSASILALAWSMPVRRL